MDSNKNLKAEKEIKETNKKVNKEQFNLHKYSKLIETADDFFEAAIRCNFD